MPTQAIAGTVFGGALAALETVVLPVWITGDAAGEAAALAFARGEKLIAGSAEASASAAATALGIAVALDGGTAAGADAAASVTVAAQIAAAAGGGAAADLPGLAAAGGVAAFPVLAMATAAGAAPADLHVSVGWAAAMDAAGDSAASGWIGVALPQVRPTAAGEYPGAVNLVANPSLEYAGAGLLGWSGTGLARDGAVGWSGSASAASTRGSAGTQAVTIQSVSGLAARGPAAWIGSVWARAEQAVTVTATLAAVDGATEIVGEGIAFELPATGEWVRSYAFVLLAEGERADVLELRVSAALPGAGTVWLDGAQIEADTGYGMTSYLDGDAGDIYRWGGEPGASPSAREPR